MADDRTQYKELCQFLELFHGRFTESEAAVILQSQDGLSEAVKWVFHTETNEIRRVLDNDANSWTTIGRKIKILRQQGRSILDRARSGTIYTEARLFACGPCNHFWWRRTPTRKKVSRCNRCRVRYDAVPREEEWGWAEFHCTHCHKEFRGWCAMKMTSPCFGCGHLVYPTRILPPRRQERTPGRGMHVCSAADCPGRQHYSGGPTNPDPNARCVHPKSLAMHGLNQVVTTSRRHDGTGSTVDTFVSQTDLCKSHDQYFPQLPSISERSGEDGNRPDDSKR